jgi:multimeric flavodoxin WrbA
MEIGPCSSCWSCWSKKRPGECVQKDDFEQILDVYKRADYLLLAAPLYIFDLPATVKNVIDRFFITQAPSQIECPDGNTEHPKRFVRPRKAVLISSCGFPEIENFDILRRHFRIICQHMVWQWSGEILISAAGVANAPKLFDEKHELIKRAGAELIEGGISQEVADAIAAPVMPAEDCRRFATLSFEGGVVAKAKVASIVAKAMRRNKGST